ncbi:MAG: hypothetical protein JST00_34460 [Deltaproteobacteria bacterium]|nr:hypothetical protein [Deltaproteobacteria bacterium]
MTYREDDGPLAERYDAIKRSLDELRTQSSVLAAEEAALSRELEDVRGAIARKGGEARRHLPLANVQIASPCTAEWESMIGDDRKRHCTECSKDVYDLTVMTRDEVDAFLLANASGACVRLYQRTDGRMLTQDCPVGVRRRRARALTAVAVGIGTCAMVAFTALSTVLGASELDHCRPPPPPMAAPPLGTTPPVGTLRQSTAFADPSAKTGIGFVWIEAPEGTRLYEGERFLGTAPLQLAAIEGTHVIRGVEPKTNRTRSALAIVRAQEVTAVSIDMAAPVPRPKMLGAMAGPPPNSL